MSGVASPPSPFGGWSTEIETLRDALVVPPDQSAFVQETGIVSQTGQFCEQGALWRKHRPLTTAPEPVSDAPDTLPGRWLWGGVLWSNFGHFLAESTARLWALDHLNEPVDGILFVPKRPKNGDRLKGFHQPFFDLMGIKTPLRVATRPVRVETLVVPGQGFGLGAISTGTDKVRAQFAARFARDVAPEGPEKLYVSRSALGFERGSIIGETLIEEKLAADGYEIFHPQDHPLEVQVARYRAARQVVATDGSALHLLAFAMPREQRLAIIARRVSSAVDLLVDHIGAFTGQRPHLINAVRWSWFPEGEPSVRRLAMGELDLTAVGSELAAAGFVSGGESWANLSDAEVDAILQGTGRGWHLKRWAARQRAEAAGS
ncbi:MAG: glycosyltransferase family 61 protein [Marinibacterium sp.]